MSMAGMKILDSNMFKFMVSNVIRTKRIILQALVV